MHPVSICRFNQNIICFCHFLWILDNRLIQISHISGKYDFFGNVSLCDPHLDCRRAKKMPYIRKTNIYSVTQCNSLIIITRCQQFDCCIGIRHCIERLIFRSAASPCFTIPPFRLKLLNMGTVTQHDITQI